MASFRQRNNKWQARISRDGHPDQVKTFEAKAEAERWARSVESEMDKGHFVSIRAVAITRLNCGKTLTMPIRWQVRWGWSLGLG